MFENGDPLSPLHEGMPLDDIAADPCGQQGDYTLLTTAERQQLLVEWNATEADYPRQACLHELFETQVEQSPDAIALVFEGSTLTYRELNKRANQLARYLQSRGVGSDVLVGLCVERSLNMFVAILAILKAGGAYVPLDPSYPHARLAFMLDDAALSVLVTEQSLINNLPTHEAQTICLDDREAFSCYPDTNPAVLNKADSLAYIIFTSGSTGRPKGVQIPHRALVNLLTAMCERPGLTDQDVMLAVTTLSFDMAVPEIFLALIMGARIELVSRDTATDGKQLIKQLSQGITILQATPATCRLLIESGWQGKPGLKMLCGGEAMSRDLADQLLLRGVELWNMYGPTETTVWSTAHRVTTGCGPILIGRPLANTRVYLLNSHLNPVPVGVAAELHIGGDGLARGYLKRPELTQEKFIPDPFSNDPHARLYKTGDLARYLPDGTIECLGRIDHQVKIRGYRIELGEIEAALQAHPLVCASVVIAREDTPSDKRLVAYVVSRDKTPLTDQELRNFLKERVPEYMLPPVFVLMDTLPVTPNGKLDRKSLPAPASRRPVLEQAYVAPRGELEHFLAGIWCELLRLDRVGVHDKFFELGGNSLQAAMLLNKLQRELGEFMYIVAIFNAPTIAEFAAFLRTDYAEAVARRLPADVRAAEAPRSARQQPKEIDASTIAQMRQYIVPRETSANNAKITAPKNPQAIFVLAPPRSGTTLLRVMLAGHPGLFAAAELQLLGFNTLAERKAAYLDKFGLWLEGTYRAIMEIKGCDAEQAKAIMEDYERQGYTTKEFFGVLQEWIKPRILADKSPSYAIDPESLRSAERDFESPLYIHLVRDPRAMVNSFVDYHVEQVLFLREHPFSPQQLGELVWTISHQTILDFLKDVPANRQHRIHFENLVTSPQETMEKLCLSLGLEFHPDLVQPYKNKEKKMIDGIYPASTPMGDKRFHEHQGINPEVADKGRASASELLLGDITWELAETLGYEKPPASQGNRVIEKILSSSKSATTVRSFMQHQQQRRKRHRED